MLSKNSVQYLMLVFMKSANVVHWCSLSSTMFWFQYIVLKMGQKDSVASSKNLPHGINDMYKNLSRQLALQLRFELIIVMQPLLYTKEK